MKILIKNISLLVQACDSNPHKVCGKDMATLPCIKNAFLKINNGIIDDFGSMNNISSINFESDYIILDADGRLVFPSFCDSHTHIVFAGSRENEFIDKIKGFSYEQIAKNGGGILNSAKLLHNTNEEELFNQAMTRINEVILLGTGAIEIKSGYGLNTADELKMLRVIKKIKETTPLIVKSTFLGAHAIPLEYKGKPHEYIQLIVDEMLPRIADEGLADYIDVFCEKGFFSVDETNKILEVATKYNLQPKIHANELGYSGGIQVGVNNNALSVDHLEYTSDTEIAALLNSQTMPTLLPSTSFFLGLPYAPARKMIDAGLPIALASDYNPGSSPSGNMKFVSSLACIKLKMLPTEVVNATTINGAYAMGVDNITGSITRGKIANVFITQKIPSLNFFPYSFGNNLIDTIILNGKIISSH